MIPQEMIDALNELAKDFPLHSVVYHKACDSRGIVQGYVLCALGWLLHIDYGPEQGNLNEYPGALSSTKSFAE